MSKPTFDPVYFLIVDDLDENLLALEAVQRREDLVILKARSGPQALELLLQHDIALALIDVQMPEMSGFELAELMRGIERTRTVPIIFLTAGSTDQQRRFRGYGAGAVDFLQKPVESDVLKSKAGVFFELQRRRQQVEAYVGSLKDADRRKDEFLATLAHELRNPLAPIRNGLEVLCNNPDAQKAAEVRDMMGRQLTHMVRLIDDLLDMSRISQGKIELRNEQTSLQNVLQTALEISRPHIEEARHELVLDVPDSPVAVEVDTTRIAQALGNLINNAAKYTPDGGIIKVRVSRDSDNAIITISDNGIGIPEHMLGRVFDLFTQVGSSQSNTKGGLGIGLALVQHVVDMHGGTVSAHSHGAGKGSTFTLHLPLSTAPAAIEAPVTDVFAAAAETETLRILVVDDNDAAAQTIAWMLEMMGHDIEQAHTGEEAIALARASKPDAILLDIGLPDISGYDVCRTLRAEADFKNTLMVAQTGWGQKRDRDMAFEAGFDHHLVKPASPEDFARVLATRKK